MEPYLGHETLSPFWNGINSERGIWNNATTVEKADRQKEIVRLCWNNDQQNEICIGRRNQTVSIFNTISNTIVNELNLPAGDGPFKGLYKFNSDYITCSESGCLRLWSPSADCKLELDAGPNISCMRNNPARQSLVATGGKENDLKLWSLGDSLQPLFTAKNVSNDWLNLRVPIWVTDMGFLPGSQQIVTCTNYHQVRLYDPAAGVRRPQLEVVFDESPIITMSLRPNSSHQMIVGNSHGGMALIDLRGKGGVVQRYKGAEGSIRSLSCHPSEDVVVSCGLDRYLRVHDINTRELVQKLYLKSRLNCLLVSDKVIPGSECKKEIVEDAAEMSIDETEPVYNENDDALWSTMPKVSAGPSVPAECRKLKRKQQKNPDKSSKTKKTKRTKQLK